jgi:hypothetical protein
MEYYSPSLVAKIFYNGQNARSPKGSIVSRKNVVQCFHVLSTGAGCYREKTQDDRDDQKDKFTHYWCSSLIQKSFEQLLSLLW